MSTRTRRIELDQEPDFAGGERSEPVGRAERTAGGAPIAGGLAAGRLGRELSQELVEDALDRVRAGVAAGELPARGP